MADNPRPEFTPPTYVRRLRRWRFALIVTVLAAAVVAAAAAGWRFARTSSSPAAGPFILISIDTLRADHLPVYGSRAVRTPTIDALASEGVVFERAYAHSPQTLPSHASILSGLLPFETGVRDNVGFALQPDVVLLPQMLKSRGYTSGAVVSSYLLRRETGLARAFDFYDADLPAPPPEFPAGRLERPGADSIAVAQKWIASLSSPRFLLFLHLYEPHAPYTPPERFRQYAPYDGEVAYADELVGGFLKWLKGRGLYDRATILLFSDHGESLGDHGEQEHGIFLYDETIRVPLIVKLPRDVNHGHRIAVPVQHIDLVPTVLDLLDVRRPGLRGHSLRGLIEGRRPPAGPDRAFYAEALSPRFQFGVSGTQAVTAATYRLIKAPREELYDLAQDAGEQTNIVASQSDVAARLRASFEEFNTAGDAESPARLTIEERERLASLGYLTAGPWPARVTPAADPKDHIAAIEKCRQACRLAGEQRFDEAIAAYREVVQEEPRLPAVWLQVALVLERAGRAEEAQRAFERVLKLDPDNAMALLGAARVLLGAGKFDAARAHAQKAVTTSPAAAFEMLTRVALARNDRSDAERKAKLAQQADATLPMESFVRGVTAYRAGKYEDAANAFEEALKAADARPEPVAELHYYYAETLSRLERYPDAETHLKEEIRLFPRSISPRVSLAMLYRAERRVDDARSVAEDLVRVAPSPEGYAAAARVWAILGDKDRAALLRTESMQRFGNDPFVTRGRPTR